MKVMGEFSMNNESLVKRIIESLRPSFRESVSIRASHWSCYTDTLDEALAIYDNSDNEQFIKIMNKMMSFFPRSSSQHGAITDLCSCLEENSVEFENKFKYK